MSLSDEQALRNLWDTGAFWNPAYEESKNVASVDEALKLDLQHPIALEAVKSFQESDETLTSLVIEHHGRNPVIDGKAGPATKELVRARLERDFRPEIRGCPLPDNKPPEGVKFFYEDPALQKAVESMAGFEDGPFPKGCLAGHEGVHAFRVDVDESNMPSHWRSIWDWYKTESSKNWADIGVRQIFVGHGEISEVDLSWRNGRGWIGLASALGQSCSGHGFQYLDPGYRQDKWYLLTLGEHETGHNLNSGHTRGGIMNPTILRTDGNWRTDVNFPKFKRWYGGEPIPVDPTTPDPPDDEEYNGVFTLDGEVYKIKVFQ